MSEQFNPFTIILPQLVGRGTSYEVDVCKKCSNVQLLEKSQTYTKIKVLQMVSPASGKVPRAFGSIFPMLPAPQMPHNFKIRVGTPTLDPLSSL